ncbi:hypothetical protein ABH935_004294 [Catenulispora sp. GAS73]|uniref:DUF6924 domain-containing protein n=1 Tax=Catenulispora sp. GAS73 TaxID=3156269 RepID=UPI003514EC66
MPFPMLPLPAPGEVLLVNTCYEDDGTPLWDAILQTVGGRRDEDLVILGDGDGDVRLRLTENPGWDYLHGGDFPALLPPGFDAPVIAQADISAVYGADAMMLIDLREVPGRGVRIPTAELGRVLPGLHDGTISFDELIRGMDRCGTYLGDAGEPTNPTPTGVVRTSFPQLPVYPLTLLVRTDFENHEGWSSLLSALGDLTEDNETQVDFSDTGSSDLGLSALVVDDPAFESLQPGQVPALVPTVGRNDQHTTMVALADAQTLADPVHRLLVVDLHDTPGQSIRMPLAGAGSLAANLEIANMDFYEFENYEGWNG